MKSNSAKLVASLALAGAMCAAPLAAHANQVITLPPSIWSGFVSVPVGFPVVLNTTQVTGPGTIQGGLGNSFAGEVSLPIPQPSLNVRAGGFDGAEFSGGRAHVALEYFMEIVGPGSGLAPLHVLGAGGVTSFNGGDGFASLDMATPGIEFRTAVDSHSGVLTIGDADGLQLIVPDGSSFGIDGTMLFPINTVIDVRMVAIADSDIEFGPSAASALIDPIFSIDPSFANAGLYSIITSDGIGNGGAGGVPEPSVWALMLVGFGTLGAALRRRRRPASAPA